MSGYSIADSYAILAHEMGHACGLNHPNLASGSELPGHLTASRGDGFAPSCREALAGYFSDKLGPQTSAYWIEGYTFLIWQVYGDAPAALRERLYAVLEMIVRADRPLPPDFFQSAARAWDRHTYHAVRALSRVAGRASSHQ